MSILQLKPSFKGGSGYAAIQEPSPPGWADNDVYTKSKWYYSNQDNAFFFYHMQDNRKFYIQVGMNRSDFASARFITETFEILNEHKNDDGSVDADIKITLSPFTGQRTDYAGTTGVSVVMNLYIGSTRVGGYTGNTAQPSTSPISPNPVTVHVKLAPQEQAESTQLKFVYNYPNGEYDSSTLLVGAVIYNPTPPQYVPMSIRKNEWKSLNKNNGFIKIRKSSSWVDMSKENNNTMRQPNQGHNRIRRGGAWLQQPPL